MTEFDKMDDAQKVLRKAENSDEWFGVAIGGLYAATTGKAHTIHVTDLQEIGGQRHVTIAETAQRWSRRISLNAFLQSYRPA